MSTAGSIVVQIVKDSWFQSEVPGVSHPNHVGASSQIASVSVHQWLWPLSAAKVQHYCHQHNQLG